MDPAASVLERSAADQSAPVPASSQARRWRGLAWPRQAWWVELVVVAVGYGLYEVVQGAAPSREGVAFANAGRLMRLEHWWHIDGELAVDHWVNAHHWLALLAGCYYSTLHYGVTVSVLVWLFFRHPVRYGRWRSAVVVASVGSLAVYYLWPLAPPRMAWPGMVDTLAVHHIFGAVAKHGSDQLVNDFAAMPSLHVGWAIWCAVAVTGTLTARWRYLAWLYPVATTLVVMGTGNHYLLDGVGGAVAIGLGLVLTARPWFRQDQPDEPERSGGSGPDAAAGRPASA